MTGPLGIKVLGVRHVSRVEGGKIAVVGVGCTGVEEER